MASYKGSGFPFFGMLDTVVRETGLAMLILKIDLNDGSSKQGKPLLASIGENWVLTNVLQEKKLHQTTSTPPEPTHLVFLLLLSKYLLL